MTALLVVVAVIAFELSSNASVGVAIGCLKFAWDDFADGIWLLRADPDRRRGRASFLIHAARGLIKASLCGFLGGIAIAIAVSNFGNRLGWPKRVAEAQLVGAALITVIGLMLSALFGMAASLLAIRSRFKLWIGPETRWARHYKEWPPRVRWATGPRGNRAEAPLVATVSGVGCLSVVAIVVPLIALISVLRIQANNAGLLVALMTVLILVAACLLLMLRDVMKNRIKANHPDECWPEVRYGEF